MILSKAKRIDVQKKKYFHTRNSAFRFLIENGVTSYPLDLKRIVKNNGWKVKDLKKYVIEHPELRNYVKKGEGLTLHTGDSYIILVDFSKPPQRIHFTVAHEIGHIYLGTKLEKEANMFAARILMPMLIIRELNLKTPEEIAKTFDVSIEAGTFRLKRYELIKGREKFYTSPLERRLHEQLKEFIQRSR